MRRVSLVVRVGVLLLVASTVGCAHAPILDDGNNATVLVVNRTQFDITVLLNRGGRRQRLGLVPAAGEREFTVSDVLSSGAGGATLLADPVGTDRVHQSPRFRLAGGDELFWTLMPNLANSFLMVGN